MCRRIAHRQCAGERGCIGVAGFDFIADDSGRSYTYDINTNTKYNAEVEAADGRSGMGHLAEALGREQVNERSAAAAQANLGLRLAE